MPRYRNTNKFLRLDKNGVPIPQWKLDVLNKNRRGSKKIKYVEVPLHPLPSPSPSPPPPPPKEETKVKKLINYFENLKKQ